MKLYPESKEDEGVVSMLAAIVEQFCGTHPSSGISTVDVMECMVLCSNKEWMNIFLPDGDKAGFNFFFEGMAVRVAVNSFLKARLYLEHIDAITIDRSDLDQCIGVGPEMDSVKALFPDGFVPLARYALIALSNMKQIRAKLLCSICNVQ